MGDKLDFDYNELKKFVDQPVDVSAFVFRRVGYEETHIDDGKDIRFLFPVRKYVFFPDEPKVFP
jgi:hypothetical protein